MDAWHDIDYCYQGDVHRGRFCLVGDKVKLSTAIGQKSALRGMNAELTARLLFGELLRETSEPS